MTGLTLSLARSLTRRDQSSRIYSRILRMMPRTISSSTTSIKAITSRPKMQIPMMAPTKSAVVGEPELATGGPHVGSYLYAHLSVLGLQPRCRHLASGQSCAVWQQNCPPANRCWHRPPIHTSVVHEFWSWQSLSLTHTMAEVGGGGGGGPTCGFMSASTVVARAATTTTKST